MSEFNCLAVVLFGVMFSCSLFDSFELQEIVVSQNMEPLSLRSTSRGVMMNMLRYDIFFLILETEELISNIGSHPILQEASEL